MRNVKACRRVVGVMLPRVSPRALDPTAAVSLRFRFGGMWVNKQQLRKTVGQIVELVPRATYLDAAGQPTPGGEDWYVQEVTDAGMRIVNRVSQHFTILGLDNIAEYLSNPARDTNEETHGKLKLKVQLFVEGTEVWSVPTPRPGEAVAAPTPRLPLAAAKILRWLSDNVGTSLTSPELAGVAPDECFREVVRMHHDGLLVAKILRGNGGVAAAVARHITEQGRRRLAEHYVRVTERLL